MMKKADKFEGIKKMLLAARKAGNRAATTEGFCIDQGLSWEVYSFYTGFIAGMADYMYPYYKARREETALGAELMSAKDRKAMKSPIWKFWSELLHGLGLKCHEDDFECIWKAYERLERCGADKKDGAIVPGGNTDRMFRKNIDIELGIRLAAAKAMTPAEMEYKAELKRLTRQKKNLAARLTDASNHIQDLEKTLEMLGVLGEGHELVVKFKAELETAKDNLEQTKEKMESCEGKLENCTLENVKKRLEAERIIKKMTAEDRKKEKEAKKAKEEKKEEEPKEEPEKAEK